MLFLYERHQPAESRLAHVELERETADPQAHIEHLVDHTSSIFNMEDAMREQLVMHELQIIFRPDFLKRFAELLCAFSCKIGTYYTQNRIHRVIHRTVVDSKP